MLTNIEIMSDNDIYVLINTGNINNRDDIHILQKELHKRSVTKRADINIYASRLRLASIERGLLFQEYQDRKYNSAFYKQAHAELLID